jgi:hypothetical protein
VVRGGEGVMRAVENSGRIGVDGLGLPVLIYGVATVRVRRRGSSPATAMRALGGAVGVVSVWRDGEERRV